MITLRHVAIPTHISQNVVSFRWPFFIIIIICQRAHLELSLRNHVILWNWISTANTQTFSTYGKHQHQKQCCVKILFGVRLLFETRSDRTVLRRSSRTGTMKEKGTVWYSQVGREGRWRLGGHAYCLKFFLLLFWEILSSVEHNDIKETKKKCFKW